MSESELDKLAAMAKKLPWWGWAGMGGAGLGVAVYLRKAAQAGKPADVASSSATSATSAQPEYQPPDGLSMGDLAGMPFDYYDWSAAGAPNDQPQPSGAPDQPTTPVIGPPIVAPGPGAVTPPTPPVWQQGPVSPGNPPPAPPHAPPIVSPGNPPPTPPVTPTAPAAQTYYHEVHAWPAWDSTLSGIAGHYGMSWQSLYHFGNDEQIIDQAAHAHGHYGDEYNWLFPGEELQVPSAN